MIEKCSKDKRVIREQAINPIVTEIYHPITLDYSSKFANIEKMLKGLQTQITALENRVKILGTRKKIERSSNPWTISERWRNTAK